MESTTTYKILRNIIENEIERAWERIDKYPLPPKYRLKYKSESEARAAAKADAKRKTIKEALDEGVMALKSLRETYSEFLFEDEKWPRKWMVRNPDINKMLQRTRFNDVMNYIHEITTKKMTEQLSHLLSLTNRTMDKVIRSGQMEDNKEERELILFRFNFQIVSDKLKMSKPLLQKYLRAFAKIKIIRDLGKPGRNEPKIYAYGTWVPYGDDLKRRVPFLIQSEDWERKLKEFNLQQSQK